VDIPCHLEAPATWPEVVIRAQVRHELVCAFKEALQNIVKHSKATAVEITLALHAEGFAVTVADNGVGLPSATQATGGDGLGNMRNRLATIGGKCDVRTRPQGGTEVRFLIPLPPN
jgi:signal transduction histidine kinase